MGVLIICVALIVIAFLIGHFLMDRDYSIAYVIIGATILIGIPLALSNNGDIVKERLVETTTIGIVENVDENDNLQYVKRNIDGSFQYIRIYKDVNGQKDWEPCAIEKGEPIIIIQNDYILEPTLTVYESGYAPNFWTFSVGKMHKTYVFIVPRSISLPIYEALE